MKKVFKIFGIIALIAVIGFSMVGCDDLPASATVTSVTVNPSTASVARGANQNFSATVNGENNPAQTVTWSIVQTNKNAGTTINSSGRLTVAAAETLTSLTVRATSTADTTKSGTATVTITGGGGGSETVVGSYNANASNPYVSLLSPVNYQIVNIPGETRANVMKVTNPTQWAAAFYSLSEYKDQEITIDFSVQIKRVGAAGSLVWNINNSNYPVVGNIINNAAAGTWHTMGGKWTGTPTAEHPSLYLSTYENNSGTTTYYIDSFSISVTPALPPITDDEGIVSFIYYWVNEQDVLATAGGSTTLSKETNENVVITASGSGYSGQKWYVDGVEDTSSQGQTSYTFSSTDKETKHYNLGLVVEKGGKYYSINFKITVDK